MSIKRDLSCAETELSNASICIENGIGSDGSSALIATDERYFEGALQTVQCAALAGACLIAMSAIWAVLDGEFFLSLICCAAALLVFILGIQGVRRKEHSYLVSFLVVVALAAVYSFVKVVLCTTFILAVASRSDADIIRAFSTTKTRLLTIYALECLVSVSLTTFWAVAAYSTYRLVQLVSERRARTVQRHQINAIRDSIEATVVDVRSPTPQDSPLGKTII